MGFTLSLQHYRFSTSNQRLIKMYKLAVIVVLALVAATQAVNIRRLQPFAEPEPQCDTLEILGCATEVGGAFLDCSNVANIVTCIQDILGASNCGNCVCDVLQYLGLYIC